MLVHIAARPVAVAMLALALALPVMTASAQQPSAAAVATAKELITIKGGVTVYQTIIVGMVEQVRSVLLRANPLLGKDLGEVGAKLRAEYLPRSADLVNDAARLYATRFTEQELKDALAFYKSPLGRKLLVEEASILDQSLKQAEQWANRLSEEVIGKFRTEMKKRGHEI
jgi:uncharacterized protein